MHLLNDFNAEYSSSSVESNNASLLLQMIQEVQYHLMIHVYILSSYA